MQHGASEKHWVAPPQLLGLVQTGGIVGIYLEEDEEVEWTYLNNQVVGYVIKKK